MLTTSPNNYLKPTAFDELRYGYFDRAFGNMLKAIRGGTDPTGVMALAMCCISALSEIDWSIDNQQELETTGELKPMNRQRRELLGYKTNLMFESWLNRWLAKINPGCDAAKVYGVRCALIHTAGASAALSKTGVKAWKITVNYSSEHYQVIPEDVPRFRLEMPDFLAELMLATDTFLNDRKTEIDNATPELRLCIGFLAGLTSTDENGRITGRLLRNEQSLAWFDEKLSATPLQVSKDGLADKIRQAYNDVTDLVLQ